MSDTFWLSEKEFREQKFGSPSFESDIRHALIEIAVSLHGIAQQLAIEFGTLPFREDEEEEE